MKTTRTVVCLAALTLMGAGCSSETITERLVEEAAEQVAGEGAEIDLDLDEDGGGISIESSEGSMQMGTGGSVPDSFPDSLPLPDADHEVANSFETSDSDGEVEIQMSLLTAAPVEDLEGYFEQALPDAGWDITDTRRQSMEDFVNVTFVVEQGDRGALVTVTSDRQGETLVNYLVGDANGT